MDQRWQTLAQRYGVATEFHDWRGQRTEIAEETLARVLETLGVDVADLDRALVDADLESWRRMLPPTVVATEGDTPWVPVHLPHGGSVELIVELEAGGSRHASQVDHWVDPREVDGVLTGEATFALPADLPAGYHTLRARVGDGNEATAHLIVTPPRLHLPASLAHRRQWGVMTQAYQVRSAGSWGIGDLADLGELSRWAARLGAGFVLVNPMHAAQPVAPIEPSPYLPTTRRWASPLVLRVEDTPEYGALPAATRATIDAIAAEARALNAEDTIDRDAVWAAKRAALEILYVAGPLGDDFADWTDRQGEALTRFAVWCVAFEEYGDQVDPESGESTWPAGLAAADGQAIEAFRVAHHERVRFHAWLQYLLARQFAEAQGAALAAGMEVGIVHDLAVGVHPSGADAWALRDVLARGVQVGAPPDQFNQLGQDWSQPPWHPRGLADVGYAPFRDIVRGLLSEAGGLRIDHVIGLFRLWWIPSGEPASAGTYVRYDHEAMIGILVLEAARAGSVVIGEDLGVVEPFARDYLASRGLLGTSIVFFEWADGRPLPPEHYRELCLATVTTHDLPPTAGYLDLAHVDLRERLGLLTRSVEEERAAERESLDAIRAALVERGLLAPGAPIEDQVQALHAWLARTPSRMLGVALADLVGDRRIINQPGTNDEYPNWRLPLAGPDGALVTLEDVETSSYAARLAAVLGSPSRM